MKNFTKNFLLFFFLSINLACLCMEEHINNNQPIEEIKHQETTAEELELIGEIWTNILEHDFNLSTLNEAKDIFEAIEMVEKYLKKCFLTIELCDAFKDLNISKEQWNEFKRKTRELYIPYLNEKFLEAREDTNGLYPKNDEWDDSRIINKSVAQFIVTRILTYDYSLIQLMIPGYPELNLLNLLLFYGLDINIKSRTGRTLLNDIMNWSCINNNTNLVSLLLDHQADPNNQDKNGNTSLLSALKINSKKAIIKLLLAAGADPNMRNNREENALYLAIRHKKRSKIIGLLLQYGANPNIPEHYFGNTSLHAAFYYENNDIIIPLLEFGANPHLKDKQGKTVFDIAKENNCVEFPQLVRKYAQNTLTKICLLHILNNLSLYEGKLDILPAKLRDKINSLRTN